MLLVMSLSSLAQTYPFREYTSDDGLPQLETMGAMQDSRGYIWMNTRNGLAQFDGHSFTSLLPKGRSAVKYCHTDHRRCRRHDLGCHH